VKGRWKLDSVLERTGDQPRARQGSLPAEGVSDRESTALQSGR